MCNSNSPGQAEIFKEKREEILVEAHKNDTGGGELIPQEVVESTHTEAEDQLEQDIAAVATQTVEVPQLTAAAPVFQNQSASLYRQRAARPLKESEKKSVRKQAAQQQSQEDRVRKGGVNRRIDELILRQQNRTITSDELLERSMLSAELSVFEAAAREKDREDANGGLRRKNERKYGRAKPGSSMKKAAEVDVDNLVRNLRMDIALEGNAPLTPDMQEAFEAYHFTHILGAKTIEGYDRELWAMRERKEPEERIQEVKNRRKKLEVLVLWQKSNASNFSVSLSGMAQQLRALRLARQQIENEREGSPNYTQEMLRILDEKLVGAQEEYDNYLHYLRTADRENAGEAKADALLAAQAELARLSREQRGAGDDTEGQQELTARAQAIFDNFDY